MWAVLYVLGAGAYSWFALPWILHRVGPVSGKADDVELWASVSLTLLQAVFWPFFAVVGLIVLISGSGPDR